MAFLFSRRANLISSGVTAHSFCHLKPMSCSQFIVGSSCPEGNSESRRLSRISFSRTSVRLELDVSFFTMALYGKPHGSSSTNVKSSVQALSFALEISRFSSALAVLYRIWVARISHSTPLDLALSKCLRALILSSAPEPSRRVRDTRTRHAIASHSATTYDIKSWARRARFRLTWSMLAISNTFNALWPPI